MSKPAKLGPAFNEPSVDAFEWPTLNGPCTVVRVKAEHCRQANDGTGDWEIFIPSKQIVPAELAILDRLFPNSMRLIEKALATEALLANIQ